ncbi:MAG: hypothetical protein QF437_21215 [Planctomycetota bacterium]|nr:hypothetical protein [Planctomycetota bacterium]
MQKTDRAMASRAYDMSFIKHPLSIRTEREQRRAVVAAANHRRETVALPRYERKRDHPIPASNGDRQAR